MSKNTFEDYLQDRHAAIYTGVDDDMSDHYDYWLSNLDTQNLIDYAEVYGMDRFNAGMKEVIDQI